MGNAISSVGDWFEGTWEDLTDVGKDILNIFKGPIEWFMNAFSSVLESISGIWNIFKSLIDLVGLLDDIAEIFIKILKFVFGDFLNFVKSIGENLLRFIEPIKKIITFMIDLLTENLYLPQLLFLMMPMLFGLYIIMRLISTI